MRTRAGRLGGGTGWGAGVMSLQSRAEIVGEGGESGRKKSPTGTASADGAHNGY